MASRIKWLPPVRRVLNVVVHLAPNDETGLFCAMGPDYTAQFGETAFYKAWQAIINHPDTNPILRNALIQIDFKKKYPDGFHIGPYISKKRTAGPPIQSDIHLAFFYVTPNMVRWDPDTKLQFVEKKGVKPGEHVVYLSQLWTVREKAFFRGLGFAMLCKTLSEMVRVRRISVEDHMTLHASGDFENSAMHRLVGYYESIGFAIGPEWLSEDALERGNWNPKKSFEWFRTSVASLWVPMAGIISDIQERCKFKGRTVNPRTISWATVASTEPVYEERHGVSQKGRAKKITLWHPMLYRDVRFIAPHPRYKK